MQIQNNFATYIKYMVARKSNLVEIILDDNQGQYSQAADLIFPLNGQDQVTLAKKAMEKQRSAFFLRNGGVLFIGDLYSSYADTTPGGASEKNFNSFKSFIDRFQAKDKPREQVSYPPASRFVTYQSEKVPDYLTYQAQIEYLALPGGDRKNFFMQLSDTVQIYEIQYSENIFKITVDAFIKSFRPVLLLKNEYNDKIINNIITVHAIVTDYTKQIDDEVSSPTICRESCKDLRKYEKLL